MIYGISFIVYIYLSSDNEKAQKYTMDIVCYDDISLLINQYKKLLTFLAKMQ